MRYKGIKYKLIPDFESYGITQNGYALDLRTGRLFRQVGNIGYNIVKLKGFGKRKTFKVSILVATAFVPNPKNLPIVDHKDGNPLNDDYTNLRWCTQKENLSFSDKLGVKGNPIEQLNMKTGKVIATYDTAIAAKRVTGISNRNICSVIKGKRANAGGYLWRLKVI